MSITKNLWGAHLFVPANNAGFIDKLPFIKVRNAILDLEWATNYDKKNEGRCFVRHAIKYLKSSNPALNVTVRVNTPRGEKLFKADMQKIIRAEPDIIRIPSVTKMEEVLIADEIISEYEHWLGSPVKTKLHLMIENPEGFENILEIASVSRFTEAICLGGEDWVSNIGMERKKTSHELNFIRNYLVIVAARYNLVAIDSVYPWIDDLEGMREDSEYSRNLGFIARAIQNPRQIKIVNEIYRPSVEKTEWAEQLLTELEIVDHLGTELYLSNGKIMDPLAVNRAEIIRSYVQ